MPEPIVFDGLTLVLADERGQVVYRHEGYQGGVVAFDPPETMRPGVYRWAVSVAGGPPVLGAPFQWPYDGPKVPR